MNKLDKIKTTRFTSTSKKSFDKQLKEFDSVVSEMRHRFILGFEKYGDYTLKTSKKNAVQEFREEMIDSMNHIFFLYLRVVRNKSLR